MTTQGFRLKKIRQNLNVTQQDLADKLGLKIQSISKVENNNGYFSSEVLSKLLVEFNVNLNYLIGGIEPMFLTKQDKESIPSLDDVTKLVDALLDKKLKEKGF
jgi:transcriptional regulator with XRE-family HTH domain